MTAFDHFQHATVLIAMGLMPDANKAGRMADAHEALTAAIAEIDRTGEDAHMRAHIDALRSTVARSQVCVTQ